MMASANVELVRSFGAAWERGDFPGMAERVHPTIEFVTADGPDAGVVIGLESVERGWREYLSMWKDYRWAVEEVRELAGERVLVLGHLSGRGKTSGLDLGELPPGVAAVFHVHDGKITKIVRYWDRDRADADLGLGPEADSPVS
jgi:ketosteroid isomerase-like protein